MASQRDIRRRIGSVKNIKQITRAMQFVAASKLKRAQDATLAARPYSEKLDEVLADLAAVLSGDDHPLPIYIKNGVPVAISTDDEGVARSDMTHEYLRAVEGYRLPYTELKRMARQSIEHSFLPGQSLWAETKGSFRPVAASIRRASRRER